MLLLLPVSCIPSDTLWDEYFSEYIREGKHGKKEIEIVTKYRNNKVIYKILESKEKKYELDIIFKSLSSMYSLIVWECKVWLIIF